MYTISQTYGRRRHRRKDLHVKFRWWSSVQHKRTVGSNTVLWCREKKQCKQKMDMGDDYLYLKKQNIVFWIPKYSSIYASKTKPQRERATLSAPCASLITSDEGWVGESSFPNDESSCSLFPGSSSILNGCDNFCAQMVFLGSFAVHVLSCPCR